MRARRMLANGRSSRWALWDRFEIPDYDGDGNYLTRIRVVQTPLGGIYLHRMDGPDPRSTLHCHPWPFVSIILRGGYIERRLNAHTMQVDEHRVVRFVTRKHPFTAHAITRLLRTPTWTLVLVGRRVRTWGYWEPPQPSWVGCRTVEFEDLHSRDHGWTFTEFDQHYHADEFAAALRRRNQKKVAW